jgi:hypothetical protein
MEYEKDNPKCLSHQGDDVELHVAIYESHLKLIPKRKKIEWGAEV